MFHASSSSALWVWSLRATLLLVLGLTGLLALRQVAGGDVGFHLRAGNHILEGNGWPSTDPFTYTVQDHPYVDTTWGYQVLLALIERAGGSAGMVLFHSGLVLALVLLLYHTVRLAPALPPLALAMLLMGGVAAEMRYEVRPELVSYLLLALILHLLHRHAEGRPAPLWCLPPIFLVWVNMHALFVLGWVALICFLVGLAVRDRRLDLRLAAWSALSAGITLVNPYGWRALTFPLTLASRLGEQNVFNQSIGEFTSPFDLGLSEQFPFHPRLPIFSYRLFVVLAVLALVPLFKQRRYWCVALGLPFAYLSFRMTRNIPLVVVGCLPSTVWGLSDLILTTRFGLDRRFHRGLVAATAVIAILLGLRVQNDAYYLASRRLDRFGLAWNRLTLPIEASLYVQQAGLEGRMLNHLNFGGYLMWALDEPVFIDGRLEVIGERFFVGYQELLASAEALAAGVARHRIGWIIVPHLLTPRLIGHLATDRRWRLVYVDHLAAIFVRTDRFPATRIDDGVQPPRFAGQVPIDTLPGLGGSPRTRKAVRWLAGLVRRQTFPSETFNRGLFDYFRGEPALASSSFAEAIRESDGAYFEIYLNLASALYRSGRLAEARDCYRVVLDDEPANRLAQERVAEIERKLAGR